MVLPKIMGDNENQDDSPLHIERIAMSTHRRRGRPKLPTHKLLQPFCVRVSREDVEALYVQWHAGGGAGRFSTWLRERLLREP